MFHIIKLGGSLLTSGQLDSWLEIIQTYADQKAIVIPGGGCFADEVRNLQHTYQFSDIAAHQMAILSMEQYAHLIQDRAKGLHSLAAHCVSDFVNETFTRPLLWLPSPLLRNDNSLTPCWNTSSDAIALWLAKQLNTCALYYIKSTQQGISSWNIEQLGQANILDPETLRNISSVPFSIHCFEKTNQDELKEALSQAKK